MSRQRLCLVLGGSVCAAVLLVPRTLLGGFGPAWGGDASRAEQGVAPQKTIERGRYLVEQVAVCGDCHTPHGPRGEPDKSRWLQGSTLDFQPTQPVPEWANFAPPLVGLPGYTNAEILKLLETGVGRTGKPLRPPMPSYRLSAEDARAVSAYLRSLKPIPAQRTKH